MKCKLVTSEGEANPRPVSAVLTFQKFLVSKSVHNASNYYELPDSSNVISVLGNTGLFHPVSVTVPYHLAVGVNSLVGFS